MIRIEVETNCWRQKVVETNSSGDDLSGDEKQWRRIVVETNCWRQIVRRRIVVETKVVETDSSGHSSGHELQWETNSSGDELLKTSSQATNCLETKSRGTEITWSM